MHTRRTILCLAIIFVWSAYNPDMVSAQSSEWVAAARLYNENYQRAAAAQNAGDYSGAEEWHRKNLALVESTSGVPPEARIQARYNLASTLTAQSRLDEAEPILDEAQGVLDANPNIDPIIKAFLMLNWGRLKGARSEFEVAEEMHEEGLAILEDRLGLSGAATAGAQISLARIQVQLGKLKKAEGNYRRGLQVLSAFEFVESNPSFLDAMNEHEALLNRLGTQ